MFEFNTVEEALEDIRQGKMIMVIDDEDRENEGDLIMSAEYMTTEAMNFIAKYARGIICLPADEGFMERLMLPQMVKENTDNHSTAFTVSIDHKDTTTGVSAEERAYTARKFTEDNAKPDDFRRPGHIFPLLTRSGGVLERRGHTEATVDIMKLAGLKHAGICCEIMNDDGTMARLPELIEFSRKHELTFISIAQLIEYINKNGMPKENTAKSCKHLIKQVETKLMTRYGEFNIQGYTDIDGKEHLALYMGDITGDEPVLCRVHSECLTGDALGSAKCDCGQQYDEAMKRIAKEGRGILLYMRQEGRGIGLINKLKAYELQRQGMDTVEANLALGFPEDMRRYDKAAEILRELGISSIRLMTNNPDKIKKLEQCGIKVAERVPIIVGHSHCADFYMHTKQEKMGHLLNI